MLALDPAGLRPDVEQRPAEETPRNLMGFKDGTNNLEIATTPALDDHVWVPRRTTPAWMRGGTYLVVRRIRILIEVWDRPSLDDQEPTIGRHKGERRAAGRGRRVRPLDLEAQDGDGEPDDPRRRPRATGAPSDERRRAHAAARATPSPTASTRTTGELDAGLFFLAFQQRPARRSSCRCRRPWQGDDALNEYIKHVGSAIFAVPGGIAPGASVGDALFAEGDGRSRPPATMPRCLPTPRCFVGSTSAARA